MIRFPIILTVVLSLACLTAAAAPANDLFADRSPLSGKAIAVSASNVDAGKEPGEPNHAGNRGGRSVWWTWTAPSSSTVTVSTEGSTFDTLLQIYTGSTLTTLTGVAADDDNGANLTSVTSFEAVAGTTYQIAVDGYSGASGGISLSILVGGGETVVVVPRGAVWKFFDQGTDQGTTWHGLKFDDSTWGSGAAELGYGEGDEATVVGFGPNSNNKYITTYFRHSFNFTQAAAVTNLLVRLLRDDGAVVYLNGTEMFRSNMPSGPVTAATLAVNGITGAAEATFFETVIPASALHDGENIIAVEVHQNLGNSSDLSFNLELEAVRAPVTTNTFVETGANWKFRDNGVDLGQLWRERLFDDSAWSSGPAQLGYGDGDESTIVSFGPNSNAKYITTYFRHAFNVGNPAAVTDLSLRVLRDDGAVVYLNGTEIFRSNMPQGPIGFTTPASSSIATAAESIFHPAVVDPQLLVAGQNVIAVEVHQSDGGSSDLSFDFGLAGVSIAGPRNTPPTASIVSPANNAILSVAVAVEITAVAVDLNGSVTNVAFYLDDIFLGADASSPFTATWANPSVGQHRLLAVAVDNHGARGTSAPVNITLVTNLPPSVSITNPADNTFVAPGATVTINVSAADPDGTVTRVQFYEGTQLLGEDSTLPYAVTWSTTTPGTYSLQAVATDNSSTRGTSAVVRVVVRDPSIQPPTLFVNFGDVWRYLDNGSNPGTAWREVGYNEASWGSGPAELGYGDGDEATVVRFGPSSNNKYITTYFRRTFSVAEPSGFTNAAVALRRDDGAVMYLNGVEVFRNNMPEGAIDYLTVASTSTADDGQGLYSVTISPFLLRDGLNVLAVEVHQATPDSSDLSFDAAMIGNEPTLPNQSPVVTLVAPTNTQFFIAPATIELTAVASDNDGRVTQVEFFANGLSLGRTLATPFTLTWADVPAGNYTLTAVARDHSGATATSASIFVTVNTAVPTANDDFINRIQLVDSGTYFGANHTATKEVGEPNHASTLGGRSAWWSYTTLTNGPLTITTAGSSFNTLLAVYTGDSVSGLTLIDANDDDPLGGNTSRVTINAQAGTEYQIAVDGASGARGSIVLNLGNKPPRIVAIAPSPGTLSELHEITIEFTRPVVGVTAAVLRVGGVAATNVTGFGTTYTFSFPPLPFGPLVVSWAEPTGITDLAVPPNPFDGQAPGATWQYLLIDTLPPLVVDLSPGAGATLRSLTEIELTFSEPVGGLNASDLLINGQPGTSLTGFGAGPYRIAFTDPGAGDVEVAWASTHGIHDLALPPNAFVPASWNYTIDPAAVDSVVINEIMYHHSARRADLEFIEVLNTASVPVNLTGWRLSRGVDFVFPAATLPGGGYLVVAADRTAFLNHYVSSATVLGNWQGNLANGGEEIQLDNAAGETVDAVVYADEGDWATRVRWTVDPRGWRWEAPHDGTTKSAELRNPALSNNNGQNWGASIPDNGTPGVRNSVQATNIAPLILEVGHLPVVPRSADPVTISARIVDELTAGLTVVLRHRDVTTNPPTAFVGDPMFDDGAHNDGAAGDGVYAAILPARGHQTVIDFYVEASDVGGQRRTWPAAARQTDLTFAQTANALYQVDDSTFAGRQALYRLIMTEEERAILASAGIRDSNAEMNGTFITIDGTSTELRYNVGARIRGAGSRGAAIPNYRVNIPSDHPWKDLTAINLNAQYGFSQVAGAAISLASGLPASTAVPIQVRVNGRNLASSGLPQYSSYALVEPVNGDWARNHYPEDPGGNAYVARRPNTDLTYLGGDYRAYESTGYEKQSNGSDNDWSDLIGLTSVLDLSPNSTYVDNVRAVANVEEWMIYFAMNALLGNGETSLGTGVGDDYDLYRGVFDPRFLLVAHDWDTILAQGQGPQPFNADIFAAAELRVVDRFLKHPEFIALYYRELVRLISTTLSPGQLDPLLDRLLGDYVPANTIESMKQYARDRNAYVLGQIPTNLTINTVLPVVDGYLSSSTATTFLDGRANVLETRFVLVNGFAASWSGWQGRWSINNLPLRPGINQILVQSLRADGSELQRATIDVFYDDGSITSVGGTLAADTTWPDSGGPFRVTGDVIVPVGVTLFIQPGTTVYFAAGTSLRVEGRLVAEGSPQARVRLTREPSAASNWNGVRFLNSTGDNRIRFTDFDYCAGADALALVNSSLLLEHVTWSNTARTIIDAVNSSLTVRASEFPMTQDDQVINGQGILTGGQFIVSGNRFRGSRGLSDLIRFQGGKRPGPILQVLDNIFESGSDDGLDLIGADAHIEGNRFLNIRADVVRSDFSAAISAEDQAEITAARNIFSGGERGVLVQSGAYLTSHNNTFANTTVAAISFDNPSRGLAAGRGAGLRGDILWHNSNNFENRYVNDPVKGTVDLTVTGSLVELSPEQTWPGLGNINVPPRFQNATNDFRLATGSPALGIGPNGLDMGAEVAAGASITGEPRSPTARQTATLTVDGPGITHYRYRLNNSGYSAELPLTAPIVLAGLSNGTYRVFVLGKNSAGAWQAESNVTTSAAWVVNDQVFPVRLNEILAQNQRAVLNGTNYPDVVELFNESSGTIGLGGLHLSDDPNDPYKFTFPPGTTIGSQDYLVVYADNSAGPGLHLGFGLDDAGELLRLNSADGSLLDEIVFGPQLPDLSIGRIANGAWGLTEPTFDGPNRAAATGDPGTLRINEWLADAAAGSEDFIELWNPDTLPVNLGGLFFTDNPLSVPDQHRITPLSFVPGLGFSVFLADGNPDDGPSHLNFKLDPDEGRIALFAQDLTQIDLVTYILQRTGVAEGRQPNGSTNIVFLPLPTPGAGNPSGNVTNILTTTLQLVSMTNTWRYEESGANLGTAWRNVSFNDSAWLAGPALLYVETTPLPAPRNTPLTLGQITYYFRSSFDVQTSLAGFDLTATLLVDDGAVVYLNGTELLRVGVPINQTSSTVASRNVDNAAVENFVLPASLLLSGSNVLAVEVHQASAISSDVVWGMSLAATRSITNVLLSSLVLNEVLADNLSVTNADGSVADFVELFNPSATAVSLDDLSLSDDLAMPRLWAFPVGLTLNAGAYIVVLCDADSPASTNATGVLNTGFGLKANGDRLFLFDKPSRGTTLLDSLAFGLQAPDLSVARVPTGAGPWQLGLPTPGTVNIPAQLGSPTFLKINEWMAAPETGEDWFELYNPGTQPVALGGLFLTDDLQDRTKYVIPALSFIGTGLAGYQVFTADSAPELGADHADFRLSAGGEDIGLFAAGGVQIDAVSFDEQTSGVSEGRLPDGAAAQEFFPGTDTRGDSNFKRLTNIVINEVLTHSDLPLEDAIELLNIGTTAVNIGGWYLSDRKDSLQKFRIPNNTILAPGGFYVAYERDFNPVANDPRSFALSSADGETLWLTAANEGGVPTGERTSVKFGPAEKGVSFGRFQTSLGPEFAALREHTFGRDDPATVDDWRMGIGQTNTGPRVGPVVVSEIMYHPPNQAGLDNVLDEYLKLQNITAFAAPLYDPLHPTNTWRLRDAVKFDFPPGLILGPGDSLLVVSFAPNDAGALAAFRTRYALSASVPIVGPYEGKLPNSAGSIELHKPDEPQAPPSLDAGKVPYVLVENIHYSDHAPWSSSPDGGGDSLHRLDLQAFGNDSVNWAGAPPNPGPGLSDTDVDGLPDDWEILYGLDPRNPADAGTDRDGDSMPNRAEYEAGTNPTDSSSRLELRIAGMTPVTLEFQAMPGHSYSVEYREVVGAGTWQLLNTLDSRPTEWTARVTDVHDGSARFYRVATPKVSPGSLRLKLVAGSPIRLTFTAQANESYTIEYREDWDLPWERLSDISPEPATRTVEVLDPALRNSRFYRLRSPRRP